MDLPDLDSLMPYLGQLTFGALAGFAVGYTLKKVGKLMALLLGVLFICLQLLAYYGFVSIDWPRVQESMDPLLGAEPLNQTWRGLLELLTANVPFAAAFVPSMILGLRQG
ncbi:FUN14 domain-containing protein [soil metagenome]